MTALVDLTYVDLMALYVLGLIAMWLRFGEAPRVLFRAARERWERITSTEDRR